MDTLLTGFSHWLSAENTWLTNVASILTIAAILFGAVYWFDLRRIELRQARWKNYTDLLALVSGGGQVPVQLAALRQLMAFPKYAQITIEALESSNRIMRGMNNTQWMQFMAPEIDQVVTELRRNQSRFFQRLRAIF